jgi:hypothetical protein
MYEFSQNLRLHEMHEPVVFRGYREEWHPSYLPEFCNLPNAHLVKLLLLRRMYDTERNRPISRSRSYLSWCCDVASWPHCQDIPGPVPRWKCKQV